MDHRFWNSISYLSCAVFSYRSLFLTWGITIDKFSCRKSNRNIYLLLSLLLRFMETSAVGGDFREGSPEECDCRFVLKTLKIRCERSSVNCTGTFVVTFGILCAVSSVLDLFWGHEEL